MDYRINAQLQEQLKNKFNTIYSARKIIQTNLQCDLIEALKNRYGIFIAFRKLPMKCIKLPSDGQRKAIRFSFQWDIEFCS